MASGLIKRDGNRMDAMYEHPYSGVASNADPADIQPNQFVIGDGLFIKNGRLCTAGWAQSQALDYSTTGIANFFTGEQVIRLITILIPSGARLLCAFSDLGRVFVYNPGTNRFVLDQALTPPTPGPFIYDIQVIAGVAYVSFFNTGCIYAYTPTVSYVPATTFVGGKFLMELTGQLIAANTNMPTDSPAIKFNRYNWSAPFAFSTWDPAVDRTAGFNTIAEVQDEITGAFAMGNVGYILRDQGLSQLSPTGQALVPFDVTPLWESQFGIGCTYPDTFDQYGNLAVWFNDNNGYAFFSGNMPQAITGAAQAAIYQDINIIEDVTSEYAFISGCFFNCSENSNIPELAYVLSIVHGPNDGTEMTGIFWTLNVEQKSWTRQVVDLLATVRSLRVNPALRFVALRTKVQGIAYTQGASVATAVTNKRITGALALYGNDANPIGISYSFLFPFFNSDKGEVVPGGGDAPGFSVQYREEELRLFTQPTVRGVIVKAIGTGQLNISVNGKAFSPIVLVPGKKYYKSTGMFTGLSPQLSIFGAGFEGVVIKSAMLMTWDEGEPV